MRRSPSIFLTAAAFALVAACAQGMDGEGDNTGDDTSPTADASENPLPIDAPPPIDAAPPIDANVPIDAATPIDAPTAVDAGGPFCTMNSQCPAVDDCCFTFEPGQPGFCVVGTEFGEYCVPSE